MVPITRFARFSLVLFSLLVLSIVSSAPAGAEDEPAIPPVYLPIIGKPVLLPLDMVYIPAGPFQMGCSLDDPLCDYDNPLHSVTLSAFFLDRYEVTNARYKACVGAGACTLPVDLASGDRLDYYDDPAYADFPVTWVNWHQADAFCKWDGKRLPTEAQWEKAARGSDDTRLYPWGNATPDCTLLNYNPDYKVVGEYDLSMSCFGNTSRVGAYPSGASPYGLLDIGGNIREWIADWYDNEYYRASPVADPQGPEDGARRVVRGGAWSRSALEARVSDRYSWAPQSWLPHTGFRCARSQ